MIRPVLLGGRTSPHASSFLSWLIRTWLPVGLMLAVIAVESTHLFSSDHTSGLLRSVYQALAGPVTDAAWSTIHHHIRKTGHFTGYGILGLSWLRAWLLFWMVPMKHRPERGWRGYALCMALACTMLVASLDELHQSFLADRTGVVSDVWLDTSGAICLMLFTVVCGMLFPVRTTRS